MEFVEGQTLRDHVNGEPVEVNEAVRIIVQITSGLASIHQLDIVHRDLKTSNVIMDPKGVAKITDFGVARPGASELTGSDELLGSATHIAPETWRDGENSPQSDIYALGVIAYELVTGILPFDGKSPHELMFKHLKLIPVPPIEITPTLPRWLNSLIVRMLDKSPALRPPSAEAVLAEIDTRIRRSTVEDLRAASGAEPIESEEQDLFAAEYDENPIEVDPERVRAPTVTLSPSDRLKFSANPAMITTEEAEAESQALLERGEEAQAVIAPDFSWGAAFKDVAQGSCLALVLFLCGWGLTALSPTPWTWGMRENIPNGVAPTLGIAAVSLGLWLMIMALPQAFSLILSRGKDRGSKFLGTTLVTAGFVLAPLTFYTMHLFSWSYGEKLAQAKPILLNASASAYAALIAAFSGSSSEAAFQIAQIGSQIQLIPGVPSLTGGVLPPLYLIVGALLMWIWVLAAAGRGALGVKVSVSLALLLVIPSHLSHWLFGVSAPLVTLAPGITLGTTGALVTIVAWTVTGLAASLRRQRYSAECDHAAHETMERSQQSAAYSRSFVR